MKIECKNVIFFRLYLNREVNGILLTNLTTKHPERTGGSFVKIGRENPTLS